MRILGLSIGLDGDPRDVIDALKVRHLRDIDDKRTDAMTLVGMLHLASDGGDPLDAMSHLYSRTDIARIKVQRAENEERRKQEQLYRVLQMYAMSKGLGIDDRRSNDRRS